ncbi:hypothetical protein PG991_009246 [Apiospora marii]|uniref:Uncharacterized protein n=1 Tax=Apiospora marii TaxID=335849 RepID=A0ABR1RKE4_9PEZI
MTSAAAPPVAKGVSRALMLLTHPRACSTAFENRSSYVSQNSQVFMARRDALVCFNESFADPSFFGPEACVERHDTNGETGAWPGFEYCTFQERVHLLEKKAPPQEAQGKSAFAKDMAFQLSHWQPGQLPQLAKPLAHLRCERDSENPTVLPFEVLRQFHWALLIRNPQQSIPSLYRLSSTPAKREATGWHYFLPSEAGYAELRRMFDYLLGQGLFPGGGGSKDTTNIDGGERRWDYAMMQSCVMDAEDLLEHPERVIQTFCRYIGLDYQSSILQWDNKEDDDQAAQVFATWTAFHRDAIESRRLQARKPKTRRSKDEDFRA